MVGFFKVPRNPITWVVSLLVETETGQSIGSCMAGMSSKLENALPLFISVRKWVRPVLISGLTFNFTQTKVKGRHASQREFIS